MHSREIEARPPEPALAPAPRRPGLLETPWSYASRRPDGLLALQLCGVLPADWTLQLTRGLAWRGASLQTGYARRTEGGAWLAELAVDDRLEARLDSIDFLALATRPHEPLRRAEPRILEFELGASAAHGGSLALEVHAWDAVGLVAAVLGRAAGVGLVAAELILATEEECAFHHLGLVDRRGAAPSACQRRDLELVVSELLPG